MTDCDIDSILLEYPVSVVEIAVQIAEINIHCGEIVNIFWVVFCR